MPRDLGQGRASAAPFQKAAIFGVSRVLGARSVGAVLVIAPGALVRAP
jgi:hypothetical protein